MRESVVILQGVDNLGELNKIFPWQIFEQNVLDVSFPWAFLFLMQHVTNFFMRGIVIE